MMLFVAFGAYLAGTDRKVLVAKIDRRLRPSFLVLFAGVILWSWWA